MPYESLHASNTAISWIIPVRDGRQWLGAAVGSVIPQLRPSDEIIVIDDGSQTSPRDLLPQDPRVRLLVQPPLGIVAALERGRKEANGAFLGRLDADDLALPNRAELHRRFLVEHPEVGAVGGQARLQGSLGEGMKLYVEWINGLTCLHKVLLVESPLFHPAVTMRAAAVRGVGGYRLGDFPEDYDLWLRLVQDGWRLANIPKPVVEIRDHEARLTRTDSRYSRGAFRYLKMAYMTKLLKDTRPKIAVWGAGRGGRPWIRWALQQPGSLVAVVDSFISSSRYGYVVTPPEVLSSMELDLLIVAVGSRGAREKIRTNLKDIRPDLVEGKDWLAVC